MKLAVSAIAWKPEDDAEVAAALRQAGVAGVELAPTAYWAEPLVASRDERRACGAWWRAKGFQVPAIQSLLYGHPELNLFDLEARDHFTRYLLGMLDVAVDLGARVLVFGSPKNRLRGPLPAEEAFALAVESFTTIGAEAELRGVCFCIEPNPPAYGCDFVTTAEEGAALVRAVGSPGFGLHLDTAGLHLVGADPALEVARHVSLLRHCHLSAPNLAPVGVPCGIDHAGVLAALDAGAYQGWVSIEMRSGANRDLRKRSVVAAVQAMVASGARK